MLTQNSFGPKFFLNPHSFCSKKILGPENFGSKQFLGHKDYGQKKLPLLFWIKKLLDQKKYAQKILG